MHLSLKTKQVAGVTLIVGAAALLLNLMHLAYIARLGLTESHSRGVLLTNAIFQQASIAVTSREAARSEIQRDPGIRSLLESALGYSRNVTYAAIVDTKNQAMAHSSASLEGRVLEPQATLDVLLKRNIFAQLRAVYADRTFEVQQPLMLADEQFGAIRIGLSTALVRTDLEAALAPAAVSSLIAFGVSVFGAMLLAQLLLRPIHVLTSGLARLKQGEAGVELDLPPGDEFAELGSSFNTVSAELAQARSQLAGESARFESVVDRLEDAVAILNPDGEMVFCNTAMRVLLPQMPARGSLTAALSAGHPFRRIVERAVATKQTQGPSASRVSVPGMAQDIESLMTAHPVEDVGGRFMGVMLVCRNLAYLSQVQSTVQYSAKLAALGRLFAGVAHEVKNPLNAMTIHLELLRQKLAGTAPAPRSGRRAGAAPPGDGVGTLGEGALPSVTPVAIDVPSVMTHVSIIGDEIRRLDAVVQGFLKFMRPEELKLEPVSLHALVADVVGMVEPQAQDVGVVIANECPESLPLVRGDRAMLRQALVNLAVNAVQAMPKGGALRFSAQATTTDQVSLMVEDTGIGIAPQDLSKVFNLYFTTKEQGSGIGLSMVFRTVQLHDGHIEVQSTVGHGTTFCIVLPQAPSQELTADAPQAVRASML
ncbi:MAG: ATP-binding protein [Vicinamibacterales bacterium]